ncbi:hypothetical protein BQ8420_31325 [Nocardiopsis sp. JB363]|nr:hypothetical protein BQ8420_31325 [Nocardiopsis sp. JB363]
MAFEEKPRVRYLVGVCLQRMDLCQPIEDFLRGPVSAEQHASDLRKAA